MPKHGPRLYARSGCDDRWRLPARAEARSGEYRRSVHLCLRGHASHALQEPKLLLLWGRNPFAFACEAREDESPRDVEPVSWPMML